MIDCWRHGGAKMTFCILPPKGVGSMSAPAHKRKESWPEGRPDVNLFQVIQFQGHNIHKLRLDQKRIQSVIPHPFSRDLMGNWTTKLDDSTLGHSTFVDYLLRDRLVQQLRRWKHKALGWRQFAKVYQVTIFYFTLKSEVALGYLTSWSQAIKFPFFSPILT